MNAYDDYNREREHHKLQLKDDRQKKFISGLAEMKMRQTGCTLEEAMKDLANCNANVPASFQKNVEAVEQNGLSEFTCKTV